MTITSDLVNARLRTWLLRFILFSLMWWVLTDGVIESLFVGIPVVLIATQISTMMMPQLSWSLFGLLKFMPYFLWHSIRGGVDVAWRAMHPHLPIEPGLYDYQFRLPPGFPRVFMANIVSLLPGSLSVELEADILRIHVLDEADNIDKQLHNLENRLATILRLELRDAGNGNA